MHIHYSKAVKKLHPFHPSSVCEKSKDGILNISYSKAHFTGISSVGKMIEWFGSKVPRFCGMLSSVCFKHFEDSVIAGWGKLQRAFFFLPRSGTVKQLLDASQRRPALSDCSLIVMAAAIYLRLSGNLSRVKSLQPYSAASPFWPVIIRRSRLSLHPPLAHPPTHTHAATHAPVTCQDPGSTWAQTCPAVAVAAATFCVVRASFGRACLFETFSRHVGAETHKQVTHNKTAFSQTDFKVRLRSQRGSQWVLFWFCFFPLVDQVVTLKTGWWVTLQ